MKTYHSRSVLVLTLGFAALLSCSVELCVAQQAPSAVPNLAPNLVPNLVRFSGAVSDVNGKPLTGTVGVTYLLYREEQGGAPLWMETQNVEPDAEGRYSVMLGSTRNEGLPTDVFLSGEARWLGVQVQGQAEQPRVLLLSVPYALKAGDAQTVGGLPPSAFVLAAPPAANTTATETHADAASPATEPPPASTVTTSGGTVNTIPLFSTATNIQNSILTQTSTTAINVVGKLLLPSTGTATSSKGFYSQPLAFVASAFNSGTSTAVNQKFQLQVEPTGNDTATAAGTLNLLYGSGTAAPAETGVKINSKGLFTFAAGQIFPGTGTVTGVTTAMGSGLSGGGTTGTLTLKLLSTCSTNQILKWSGTAWACTSDANSGGTLTGVTAGTDLTGGGTTGKVTLNLDTTKVPQLASNNTFTGMQTINNNVSISSSTGFPLTVTASGNHSGISSSANWVSGYGIVGANAATGIGANGGVLGTAQSLNGVGVTGTAFSTTSGANTVGVAGSANSDIGTGVLGAGYGTSGIGVHGLSFKASSLAGGTVNVGVWGDSGATIGVLGSSDSSYGVAGESTSNYGMIGLSSSAYGIYGVSDNSDGAVGFSDNSTGVYGVYSSTSNTGAGAGPAGVWGDTFQTGGFGVLGTADDGNAFWGKNNSQGNETLYVENDAVYNGGATAPAVARFAGPGASTYCVIFQDSVSQDGDFMCTGSKSAAVPVDGNRMVRLYAVEAADNWFEDAGAEQLDNGSASVTLDRVFAQTVSGDLDYHVFLTPNGDCEGLYVANKTAHGFEVRELHGGHSNVAFDYRIMARRRGYENIRMQDVTANFAQMKRESQRIAARTAAEKAAGKTSPVAPPVMPHKKAAKAAGMATMHPPLMPIATGPAVVNAK